MKRCLRGGGGGGGGGVHGEGGCTGRLGARGGWVHGEVGCRRRFGYSGQVRVCESGCRWVRGIAPLCELQRLALVSKIPAVCRRPPP